MVVDVIQKLHLMQGSVPAHFALLDVIIQLVEVLLDFQEHPSHFFGNRFHNGTEQSLLVPKPGINRAGAGTGLLGDGPQGGVLIAFLQEFFFRTFQYRFIDALDLFCQSDHLLSKYS